jgi:methyl-accepting chemotaxis protein
MASAIGEIAHGADNLNDATASTSQSFAHLNRSVSEVEQSAQQSHALAQKATDQADRGVASVQQTVGGMKLIQTSFQGLGEIIDRLQEKSQSIGEVVKVIEGVVEQTNLLALNAAIISSHAGEHGRAFAVVAHEVKNLADRTAGSTRAIASLIEDVQREVAAAVESMAHGGERVDRGMSLSTEAVAILQAIGESAKESIQMAADIAKVTGGQSQNIQRAEQAMVQVQTIAKQLKGGTHEQDSASSEITRGVERMRELGQDVKRSTEEQRRESQHIAEAVEIVAGRINDIAGATKIQSEHAEQILQVVQVFRDATEQSGRRSEEMKRTIQSLYDRAEELQEEVGRFSV